MTCWNLNRHSDYTSSKIIDVFDERMRITCLISFNLLTSSLVITESHRVHVLMLHRGQILKRVQDDIVWPKTIQQSKEQQKCKDFQ